MIVGAVVTAAPLKYPSLPLLRDEGQTIPLRRCSDSVLSKNPIDAVRRADSTLDARRVATFVTAESLC